MYSGSATPSVVRSSNLNHANGHGRHHNHNHDNDNDQRSSISTTAARSEGSSNARSGNGSSTNTTTKPTTCVNGIGMFNSWKRNFKSPFFAMLDIIDNAIDASFGNEGDGQQASFEGRVELYTIERGKSGSITDSRPSPVTSGGAFRRKKKKDGDERNELVVVNNSLNAIEELSSVLEIHKSDKGDSTTNIGENGVGE